MATGVIDSDPQESNASQSDPQERRSSWDDPNDSLELASRHDEPRSTRREMVQTLADQYYAEKRRADDAERMLQELIIRFKAINDARLQALHDAAKANEELKLYKIQLRTAQNEIYKAQDTIEAVDRQRYNAEKEAAKFRSKARQLNEDILMSAAREEAWKLGLQEGLNRGRSNEENRFTEYAEEPRDDALDDDNNSFDESISSTDHNKYPVQPTAFIPSKQNIPPHPYPSPVPVQLTSNPPTVAHSVYPSENIRPTSIRNGYTRPSSGQRATPSPTPVPLRPPSSQSVHPSENIPPMSIRSGYIRPSSRQRATPSSTPLPGNRPPSSRGIHPSENVPPSSIRSGHTRPPSRQRLSPSSVPVPSNTRPSSPYENIRPVSILQTTPRHIAGVIPPDNFIPSLSADNKIRIPPPFEFQRAVTPERPVSPQLPTISDSQEAVMVPGPHTKAPQHKNRSHRRHSSSESNSSTLSALDIINDHPVIGIGTPMSIIPEVPSGQSSAIQLPDGDHHSRRQLSFSDSMHTPNLDSSQHMEATTNLRPHSRSTYAGSSRNARLQADNRSGNSYDSSPPNITIVQPPSRPTSMLQAGSSKTNLHNAALASVLSTHDHSTLGPGGYHSVVDPMLSPTHSRYYTMNGYAENDDDGDGSAVGRDPSMEPDWSGAAASAAHVPLLPSNSLTGPVPGGMNNLNINAIMDRKGKGKKRK